MTLFGPATESCTYLLITPSLAWGLIQARDERRRYVVRGLLVASFVLFVADQVWSWIPRSNNPLHLVMQPTAALALLVVQVSLGLTAKGTVAGDGVIGDEGRRGDRRPTSSVLRGPKLRSIKSRLSHTENFLRSEPT
jgi:hypothetical protein